jgi:hypothetical protein
VSGHVRPTPAASGHTAALPTEELLNRLRHDPEAPWGEYGPSGLTARRLGILLAEYGIRSANIRFPDGTQRKGFTRLDFADAWARYCPAPTEAGRPLGEDPSHPSQPHLPSSERDGLPPWRRRPQPYVHHSRARGRLPLRADDRRAAGPTRSTSRPACRRTLLSARPASPGTSTS